MNEKLLRSLHAQACAAVVRTDRTLSPSDNDFWPVYLTAVLEASQAPWPNALLEVMLERRRQVEFEGWTQEHDDEHDAGDLCAAASAYALSAASQLNPFSLSELDGVPVMWPQSWSNDWWKPRTPHDDLVRAAALIVAELERLERHPGDALIPGDDSDESHHHHLNGGDL